eukprot:CAMPEP_0197577156 /NCGR_PEP_ID=MMETSP1326-20131121/1895_1 /TAXON_ID=1155430 /ORGANISM="Genus nov. species nov., Strain RCC2288" /LENGTH=82 /DNA_ID=CAMNT_0043140177 /DNA_START=31 /DNA_END=276 /DNA_ORIENTATION=+
MADDDEDGVQSVEEMSANLTSYKEQLEQVEELLVGEPDNAEYLDVKESLAEVISLTEDLIATALAEGGGGGAGGAGGGGAGG